VNRLDPWSHLRWGWITNRVPWESFRFSLHACRCNRLADERAAALLDHEVDAAIADILRREGASRGGFARVHAAPDDPTSIEEATAISLVILGPGYTHAGKGVTASTATEAVSDALLRCRSAQRRFRNTLIFVAADEAGLGTAREVARKALAWETIDRDARLKGQLTTAQIADVAEKARTHREAGTKAVRAAWGHIFYPETSETPGKPFDLHQAVVSSRDRPVIPEAVFGKAKSDGVILDRLGPERLWLALKPIWPEDRSHLPLSEVAEWFASYVYLPKTRDGVVLDTAIRDSVSQLDPKFGFADSFDDATGRYVNLVWAKAPTEFLPSGALLVSEGAVRSQPAPATPSPAQAGGVPAATPPMEGPTLTKPTRFFGTVEIDPTRPVKSFDQILGAVIAELQRTPGAKVRLVLEIEAQAERGFDEGDVGDVRDNARQLRFKADSTGFGNWAQSRPFLDIDMPSGSGSLR
jgi:hypothetical protein